ncbi:hypothetical protein [Mesorhizobium sp.]|uniref:hypothetical protein n=1 Tax=Mesorhizobium sp. TaxID=1871066 RepID=UPI000FEAAEE6|nr:hypothetical protein [Mesorhizobium sp.]RWO22826.1 MAG: hypothetical protein EOS09_19345 [Mesorhizobium sp.]
MARKYTKRAHAAPTLAMFSGVIIGAEIIAHHRSIGATPVSGADIAAMRFEQFNPAVYHIGEDYFCAPDEGENLPEDPRFAWQMIATYFGRNIHRARG